MTEETVTIPKSEYDRLIESEDELLRLEAYGVDNWIGYSDALNDPEGYFADE